MPLCYKIPFICQYSSDGLVVHKSGKYFYKLQPQNPHKALNMLVVCCMVMCMKLYVVWLCVCIDG